MKVTEVFLRGVQISESPTVSEPLGVELPSRWSDDALQVNEQGHPVAQDT